MQKKQRPNNPNYIYEIRHRVLYGTFGLIWTWIISYSYGPTIIYLLLPSGIYSLLSTDITDIFMTYISTATTTTAVLGSTILIAQSILFLRPGLYRSEATLLIKLNNFALIIFFTLYAWVYPEIIQISWNFFSSYSENFTPIQLNLEPHLKTYIYHIKTIGLLLTFLGPSFIIIGMILQYSAVESLFKYRKIFYLITVILTTCISPPDPVSQLLLNIFLISIYELYLKTRLIIQQYKQTISLEDNQN